MRKRVKMESRIGQAKTPKRKKAAKAFGRFSIRVVPPQTLTATADPIWVAITDVAESSNATENDVDFEAFLNTVERKLKLKEEFHSV